MTRVVGWCSLGWIVVLLYVMVVLLAGCGRQTAQDQAYQMGLFGILANMENTKYQAQAASLPSLFNTSTCYRNAFGMVSCP